MAIHLSSETLRLWRTAAMARLEIYRLHHRNGTEIPRPPASELEAATEAIVELLDEIDRFKLEASRLDALIGGRGQGR